MDTIIADIREPTGHYLKHKSMGKWTPLVMKFHLCGLTVWEAPAKHLGCWTRQDQARWARSPRQKRGCCSCRVTFPHFQTDFHATPVLFSQLCLAHAVPVLWAFGCALKTSRSASLCAGRAEQAAVKPSCVCALTGAVTAQLPGTPRTGTGDVLSPCPHCALLPVRVYGPQRCWAAGVAVMGALGASRRGPIHHCCHRSPAVTAALNSGRCWARIPRCALGEDLRTALAWQRWQGWLRA